MEKGYVFYTDGGARPNPGKSGWGIHGFRWKRKESKKGIGLSGYIATDRGYVSKAEFEKKPEGFEVDIVNYFDGVGSSQFEESNNVAELKGFINALTHALKEPLDIVHVITDSKYVVVGTQEWLMKWKQNDWVKNDGEPVSNKDLWSKIDELLDQCNKQHMLVRITWIKGHVGFLGNDLSDSYATVAINLARQGKYRTEIETTEPEGYWKSEIERHPYLMNTTMYFVSNPETVQEGVYYLGEHNKDDDLISVRSADGAYSVVQLKEPCEYVEQLRRHVVNQVKQDSPDYVMIAYLNELYAPDNTRLINRFGKDAFLKENPLKNNFTMATNGQLITKEVIPPMLSFRMLDAVQDLSNILEIYKSGKIQETKYFVNDITDLIYEKVTKGKGKKEKIVSQLKPEFVVGFVKMEPLLKFNLLVGDKENFTIKEEKFPILLGRDLPTRNALKRLENFNPKVTVLTWQESQYCIRYVSIIESDLGIGIWAGYYSNYRYLTTDKE